LKSSSSWLTGVDAVSCRLPFLSKDYEIHIDGVSLHTPGWASAFRGGERAETHCTGVAKPEKGM